MQNIIRNNVIYRQNKDVFLSPYYEHALEALNRAIVPDAGSGEDPELPRYESGRGPGSTFDVDFWTSKPVKDADKAIKEAVEWLSK